ncbi:MAG: peptidylprolyl isomerase [Planctomycetota bacterium]
MLTWQFGDSSNRVTRIMTLEEIATEAGISIPQSSVPSIAPIPPQLSISGALHVGVDAYDPNGDPLTFFVESSDPSLLTAEVLSGNRSLSLSLPSYGEMTFQLFEQDVPRPTSRILELAQDGFYDGIFFHRVIRNFVAQGGDPTGTGSGGSSLGELDDQYHVDLQHNSRGLLSYAKAGDDTNDSQFFITDVPTPFLDFNHSVFGALTEGESNRDALTDVLTNQFDQPIFDTQIETATVFTDAENALVRLMRTGDGTGEVDITVRAQDTSGNETSHTFRVQVDPDTTNGSPFLDDLPVQAGCTSHPREFFLPGIDGEGDTLRYSAEVLGGLDFEIDVNEETGAITVTPPDGFEGELAFRASVSQVEDTTSSDTTDSQRYSVLFGPSTHQNQTNPLDISGDNAVSAIDALLLVDHLNTVGSANRVFDLPEEAAFLDPNSDCAISAIDALTVINFLNTPSGEGELASKSRGESVGELLNDPLAVSAGGMVWMSTDVLGRAVDLLSQARHSREAGDQVNASEVETMRDFDSSLRTVSDTTTRAKSILPVLRDWEFSVDEFVGDGEDLENALWWTEINKRADLAGLRG